MSKIKREYTAPSKLHLGFTKVLLEDLLEEFENNKDEEGYVWVSSSYRIDKDKINTSTNLFKIEL